MFLRIFNSNYCNTFFRSHHDFPPRLQVLDDLYDASEGGFGKQKAQKGIKFMSFPPILTLQLKRFQFDMQAMDMVKLNQEFAFPNVLDVKPYLAENQKKSTKIGSVTSASGQGQTDGTSSSNAEQSTKSSSKCGSSDEEEGKLLQQSNLNSSNLNSADRTSSCTSSDSLGSRAALCVTSNSEDTEYQLYGVMVHKGCITAGHYYAMLRPYGKSWLRFDDTVISPCSRWAAMNDNFGGGVTDFENFWKVYQDAKVSVEEMANLPLHNDLKKKHRIHSAYMLVYMGDYERICSRMC